MTVSNQTLKSDQPKPSVATSSLPMVNLPNTHHLQLADLASPQTPSHQQPKYRQRTAFHSSYHDTLSLPRETPPKVLYGGNTVGGLVTAINSGNSDKSNNNSFRNILLPPNPLPTNILKSGNNQPHSDQLNQSTDTNDNSSNSSNNGYRPLNVIDALSYLDKVKSRFSDNPNVYNQFLDIMKDFKSQSIDTPGVIDRVSNLFKGHTHLISGFNTFLPAGYRIECSTDPRDPNRIVVTTPTGKTTSTTSTLEDQRQLQMKSNGNPYYVSQTSYIQSSPLQSSNHSHPNSSPSLTTNNPTINHPSTLPPPTPSFTRPIRTASPIHEPTNKTPTTPLLPSSTSPSVKPQQTDRKSPVEFNHAINYVNRIKNRFSHNPNIYKQFLEILQTYQKEQKSIADVYTHVSYLFDGADDLLEEFKQFLPEISPEEERSYTKKQNHTSSLEEKPSQGPQNNPIPNNNPNPNAPVKRKKSYVTKKSRKLQSQQGPKPQDDEEEEEVIEYIPSPQTDHRHYAIKHDEIELFDRIKKYIGNRPSYEEFLKILNLYTQQILDLNTLVNQIKPFLSQNKELFDLFKSVLGFENTSSLDQPIAPLLPKPNISETKALESSPSYREVPHDWQVQACSARDELCWEVLNDKYVSHPTETSEDGGFAASKKNPNEEALHRCEEERYEYDLNIEANLHTIALLKPIAEQIKRMTQEEKDQFRLEPGLGGATTSIYERIVRKVYGDDRGKEIIEYLYLSPSTVVPVLLDRLQKKDVEWQKGRREWSKIWRDLDAKNYYRSLDYQGSTIKANDRKQLAPKSLIAETESAAKDEQPVQLSIDQPDKTIAKDITHLIYSFIEKQNGFTKNDKTRIKRFINTSPFLFYPKEKDEHQDLEEDLLTEDSDLDSKTPPEVTKPAKEEPIPLANQVIEEDIIMEVADALEPPDESQVEPVIETVTPNCNNKPSNFLCNSHYYCMFRLYQVLYERLSKMKSISDFVKENPKKAQKHNQIAIDLDLVSTPFYDTDLSQGYYPALLSIIDSFFEGELDQQTFEENIRYIFGIDAYIMFTIDKLIQALVKQIQTVATDKKSLEVLSLFSKIQSENIESFTNYTKDIQSVISPDENLYEVRFAT